MTTPYRMRSAGAVSLPSMTGHGTVAAVANAPGPPPPPPGRRKRLAFARQRGGVLMLVGGLLIVAGFGIAMAVVLALLLVQLFVLGAVRRYAFESQP